MPATRCAYFLGRPVEGKSEQLMQSLGAIVTGFAGLPGVTSAQLERPCFFETDALDIYAVVRLSFDRLEDIDAALAAPERQRLRQQFVEQILPLFQGTVTHVNYSAEKYRA